MLGHSADVAIADLCGLFNTIHALHEAFKYNCSTVVVAHDVDQHWTLFQQTCLTNFLLDWLQSARLSTA